MLNGGHVPKGLFIYIATLLFTHNYNKYTCWIKVIALPKEKCIANLD